MSNYLNSNQVRRVIKEEVQKMLRSRLSLNEEDNKPNSNQGAYVFADSSNDVTGNKYVYSYDTDTKKMYITTGKDGTPMNKEITQEKNKAAWDAILAQFNKINVSAVTPEEAIVPKESTDDKWNKVISAASKSVIDAILKGDTAVPTAAQAEESFQEFHKIRKEQAVRLRTKEANDTAKSQKAAFEDDEEIDIPGVTPPAAAATTVAESAFNLTRLQRLAGLLKG